jgi:NAD(P)-dependent dehydrogenase (short-subunit alcohol dehydrogenase family)
MMKATLDSLGDKVAELSPLKRIGSAEDIAGTTIYLASRAGAYTNATVIPVDGGISGVR